MSSHPPGDQQPHSLSLKVMRLSRPTLATVQTYYHERNSDVPTSAPLEELAAMDPLLSRDPPSESVVATATSQRLSDSSISTASLGLSRALTLPAAFGTIYLGETFTAYSCVCNDDNEEIRNVTLKAEIQTSSQRFTLLDTMAQALPSSHTFENILSHEIKELGVHILVCTMYYLSPAGDKRHFRKYYKFQALNPLAVKTKVNSMADGKVFLEAQIQNIAGVPMKLERMRFEPSEPFEHQDLNYVVEGEHLHADKNNGQGEGEVARNVLGEYGFLGPQDVYQYLYVLLPRANSDNDDSLARTTNALGKLDISWRSAFGASGRLQTSQLTRKPPPADNIEVVVSRVPEAVWLEKPFKIALKAINRSGENMKLVSAAVKQKMGSVLLNGLSTHTLGEVAPGKQIVFELEFFPLTPGIQRLGGLRFTDLVSGYAKDVNHLADVFVMFE
ncbi:uncharacterized protein VTP21DRAFT_4493 [Calcarisporiella thermophila]|uniref:uncharacterized protein n=1 Tax=Calcarisporiella thermophila TaxID=911321 RepID=UPI003743AD59